MRQLIVGTAGHIDHGKTALVRALTGIDTDRLPEEKRRGITIDLGFAHLDAGDLRIGFVDVPGHEAFVRNMVAGATGFDVALLVIAADEGIMPQTREHLRILELLGITHGIVALTKSDLVDSDWLDLVRDDVRRLLSESTLRATDIIAVSAKTGNGLDALRNALVATAEMVATRPGNDLFRLPVDRVFTVRGTGTVVTGTVWSGALQAGTHVRILPANIDARVRKLQTHGADADTVTAGQRAAVALAATSRDAIERGAVLVSDEAWTPSSILSVRLQALPESAGFRQRQRIRFHLGTAEIMARVALLDADAIEPGETRWAQLRLETPTVARAGDRFVIRSYSPVHTIGGGIVVEPLAPRRRRRDASACADLDALFAARTRAEEIDALAKIAGLDGVAAARLPVLTARAGDAQPTALRVADRYYAADVVAAAGSAVLDALSEFHRQNPLRQGIEHDALRQAVPRAPALADHVIGQLVALGEIERGGAAGLRLRGFQPQGSEARTAQLDALAAAIDAGGLTPPGPADLPPALGSHPQLREMLKLLEREGRLVGLGGDLYIGTRVWELAVTEIRTRYQGQQALTPADFKAALGLSRKYLIPLLEAFDRHGITRRRGEGRMVTGAQGAGEQDGAIPV